jgi:hypothetical protein
MRRLGVLLLVSVCMAPLLWRGDRTGEQSDRLEAPVVPEQIGTEFGRIDSPSVRSTSFEPYASVLPEQPTNVGQDLFGNGWFLDTQLTEARDLEWAPGMEVLIESVLRSIGGPIRDVKYVQCRTTSCVAVVTHHASLFFLDEAQRSEELISLIQQIQTAMEPVYRQSPRLGTTSVLPMVRLYSVETTLENLEDNNGTIINISGPASDE